MKILLITRGVPHAKDPQEGCFEMDQAKALRALGHEVVTMSVDSRVRRYWRKIGISETMEQGVRSYKLFLFPTAIIRHLVSSRLGYKIEAKMAQWLYSRVVRDCGEFDVIHSHFLQCTYYAAQIKRKYGGRLVATEHWSELDKSTLTPLVEYLGQAAYPCVDRMIAVSNSLKRQLKRHFDIESTVIHNLINVDLLDKSAANEEHHRGFRFISVGSLIPRKGYDLLIRAFKKTIAQTQGAEIVIIGGGPEKENLKRLIDELGLENKIHLLGQMNKVDIYRNLHCSDAFVLPSRNENFSVAVLEALANGLPVVATICGGIRECITETNGLLVPVDDEIRLSEALDKVFTNIVCYNREKIRIECLSRYSPAVIGQQIIDIYKDIL